MSSQMEELMAYAVILAALQKRKERKRRRLWHKEWLNRTAPTDVDLLEELRLYPKDWKNYLRMDEPTYLELLSLVTPYITKQDTVMRKSITPHARLLTTIRYLASGRTLEDLKFSSRISPQCLGKLIPETCRAICIALRGYTKFPSTPNEWCNVAEGFETRWNFPNCLGAMDGKHVEITPPPGSGSYFYNYKGYHSQVLFGVSNANYELIYFNYGVNGRISDGGVFQYTDLCNKLKNGTLNIPPPRMVGSERIPYVFVADDAFALSTNIMKPVNRKLAAKENKIFNYRLSRARRMIESVFGILVARFGVFQRQISFIDLDKVQSVFMACCYLHNYLRSKIPHQYTPLEWLGDEDEGTGGFSPGPRCSQNMDLQKRKQPASKSAKAVREKLAKNFNNEGRVEWQDKCIC